MKDFVADLVFSDDTMVADVVVNRPGELMRKFLTDPKRIDVFTAIVKDPALLGGAAAPDVVQAAVRVSMVFRASLVIHPSPSAFFGLQ